MNNTAIGLAGEFRVMSELLLRGYNPAKSYMDNGVDIILENGNKIQVKTATKKLKNNRSSGYRFNLTRGEKKKKLDFSLFDFLICAIPSENAFFIIPSNEIKDKTGMVFTMNDNMKTKYNKYLNNWKVLIKERE